MMTSLSGFSLSENLMEVMESKVKTAAGSMFSRGSGSTLRVKYTLQLLKVFVDASAGQRSTKD